MKISFRTSVFWGLAAISVFAFSACNRLNSVPSDVTTSSTTTLYFDVRSSADYIEAGSTVTLNATVFQRKLNQTELTRVPDSEIDPNDIMWTSTSGTFSSTHGFQVVYTAAATSGNVAVYVGLSKASKYTDLGEFDTPGIATINVVSTLTPAAPTNLSAVATDNKVSLTWSPNTEKYLGGYLVLYATGDSTTSWTNRVTVNATSSSTTISNLSNNTRFSFQIVAFSNSAIPRLSNPSSIVQAVPTDSTAPAQPTAFIASQVGTQNVIGLSWKNPTDIDFKGVRIIRRTSPGTPISPNDGVVIFDGNGSTAIDNNVQFGTLYYYTIYAYDDEKTPNYSVPVKPLVWILW